VAGAQVVIDLANSPSVAGYPDIVRNELKIAPELTIICALALGYPDPNFPTNKLRIGRDPVAKHVVFLDG